MSRQPEPPGQPRLFLAEARLLIAAARLAAARSRELLRASRVSLEETLACNDEFREEIQALRAFLRKRVRTCPV